MKRLFNRAFQTLPVIVLYVSAIIISGCQKETTQVSDIGSGLSKQQPYKEPKTLKDFVQVNLVASNSSYGAANIDPHLLNAWGIAFSPNGIAWVSSQEGHVSSVYDRNGNFISARPEVAIPSTGSSTGGNPTGTVVNIDPNATDFKLSNNATARFMFAGADGIISGWNGAAGNNALVIANNAPAASYTGLAMAHTSSGDYYLYAANFSQGKIDVWDKNFTPVQMSFTDPALPSDYSPFNIQNVGGKLYVMYAKIGADGDEVAKPGNGYVDIYDAMGTLINRFVSQGQLNAPWGVAWAPAGFFTDESGAGQDAVLIGNLGDGRINAYSTEGRFLGQLRSHGNPIVIEKLWGISFPPSTSTIDPNRLYFAAGPNDEKDGLFGYITK
ncbi:MAG TPA: TIGR03118 family protein [Flavisolibacter sp.]|nr:TIGR03118 family protein [Flavisolibacter sp.]